MPEPPRYQARAASPTQTGTPRAGPAAVGLRAFLGSRRLLVLLAGTAGCWFLLDYAYYGNTISTPQIIALITPHASQTTTIAIQLAIFAVAAVPGYALAVWRMDRIGHRKLQLVGFIMMGACFAVIGLVPGMTTAVAPFLLAYGISYFFTEFGPNVTTFVLPGELFPTRFRATGHGIWPASGSWARSSACSCSPSSSTPSGCAAPCCSPPGYRSSARCSPSSCPSPPAAAWRRSPARPRTSPRPRTRSATQASPPLSVC